MDQIQMYKEKLLIFMKEQAYKPMTVKELETALEVDDAISYKNLVKALVQMEECGEVIRTRNNRYGLPEQMNLIKGKVAANAKGFAFVIPEEKGTDDIYIPSHELNSAMHGDIVIVRIAANTTGSHREGAIIRILERGIVQSVGTYTENKGFGFVIPDEKKITNDIYIPDSARNGAIDGHKVVYRIVNYPEGVLSAEGEIIEILGHKNDPGVDILSIIYQYGLPGEFPHEVLQEAKQISEEISEKELVGRRDLRDQVIVTIDGIDAKDLDDAVTVKKLDNGNYLLGVHIADVSHYVTEGSAIDIEAYERGTSVYLVDRVISMIPHRLSNGICSLNPQVNRLTLSCEMEINQTGKIVSHEIFPSVIRTTERMSYDDVNAILVDKRDDLVEKYAPLVPMFTIMEQLANILRQKRIQRGAIDFDFKEAKVMVNKDGKPTDVIIRTRSVAEKLIEEFMLAANETVAEHFHWLDVPFIYRIHEDPNEEKLQRFFEFIINFGYIVRGTANQVHPRALQEIIDAVQGKPEELVISTIMLRSMKQAKYDVENVGHFGLSTEFYTHFTSPIRRYPDLIVHRLIRSFLFDGKLDKHTQEKWSSLLGEIAAHSSSMERRSTEAERETDSLKKAEFMLDKVGMEFDGIVCSITNFGIFVELSNTIEGLIHVSHLTDDFYHFHEEQYAMIGERTAKVYRIGDKVTVRVLAANVDERTVDFEIVAAEEIHRDPKSEVTIFKLSQNKRSKEMRSNKRDFSEKSSKNKTSEERTPVKKQTLQVNEKSRNYQTKDERNYPVKQENGRKRKSKKKDSE